MEDEGYQLRPKKLISRENSRIGQASGGSLDGLTSSNSQSSNLSSGSSFWSSSQELSDLHKILKVLHIQESDVPTSNRIKHRAVADEFFVKVLQELNKKIERVYQQSLLQDLGENFLQNARQFSEIVTNLQNYFEITSCPVKKIEILSMLPKSWKLGEIIAHFQCTAWLYKKLLSFDRDVSKY